MRRTIVVLILLLALSVTSAAGLGWKWQGHKPSRAIAGWTWDDAAQLWIDSPDA